MKQTKSKNHSAKFSAKAQHNAKRRVRDSRPIHRTIAFHPINFLFLLCTGMLLIMYTFSAAAASYTIKGEVPAPIPTVPAIITSPKNNQQLSPQIQTISGTCPTNTYIEVTDNSTLAGIAICDHTGAFQVSVSLTNGLNILSAQNFNVTNNPGPASAPVNVYYYPPTPSNNPSSPSSTPVVRSSSKATQSAYVAPVTVKVLQVDTGTAFQPAGQTQTVSYGPTFTGIAPPNSLVLVTIHTNPYYCHTYANAQGYWSCTFDQIIPPGQHTVMIMAQTASHQTINFSPFHILVVAAAPKSQIQSAKFAISTSYAYKVFLLNQLVNLDLHINGGDQPYAFTVTWGDGAISTYVEQTSTDFTITHTYTRLNAALGAMPVKIAAVDTKGDTASLQVDTVLRNPGYTASSSSNSSSGQNFISKMRPWLTVLWPGYVVLLLMVFSFWLGERQEMIALLGGKKLPK